MRVTFSNFGNAVLCDGVAVLDREREESSSMPADRGKSLHWFLRRVADVGDDVALAEIPEEFHADAESIPLDQLPCGPEFEREVSVALDLVSGEARRIGGPDDAADVRYESVGDLEVAGTLDSARLLAPGHVYVADYKSGFLCGLTAHVWQLKLGALAYAALHGARRVTAVLIRFLPDMTPRETVYEWTGEDLDTFLGEALSHGIRWLDRRARLKVLPMDATEMKPGTEQCRYCASYTHCPRKLRLVRARAEQLEQVGVSMITADMVAEAYQYAEELKKLAGRVQAECCRIAASTPVDLKNGTMLGMAPKESTDINGGIAWAVLRETFGEPHGVDVASVGVEMSASKASIDRAMKRASDLGLIPPRGRKAKRDAVMSDISRRGGLAVRETTKVRVFTPPASQPAAPANEDRAVPDLRPKILNTGSA